MFIKKSVFSLLVPILIILLLTIAGCGSSTNQNKTKDTNNPPSGSNSTSQSPTAPAKSQDSKSSNPTPSTTSIVTYENYLKIKLDTTYDEVKSILGEGKKKELNSDVIDYTWNDQNKSILVQTNKGKVVTKIQSNLGKTTSKATLAQFNQISNGMTFDQVVSVLGTDYQEVSYKEKPGNIILRNVVWMLPDSTYVKVYLQNGKVINKYSNLKK